MNIFFSGGSSVLKSLSSASIVFVRDGGMRSGRIEASGSRTKRRLDNLRCGICSLGVDLISDPAYMISRSMERGEFFFRFSERPNFLSISVHNSRATSSVTTSGISPTALRKLLVPAMQSTGAVSNTAENKDCSGSGE